VFREGERCAFAARQELKGAKRMSFQTQKESEIIAFFENIDF